MSTALSIALRSIRRTLLPSSFLLYFFLETVSSRATARKLLVLWANVVAAVKEVVVTPAEEGAVVTEVGAEEGAVVTEEGAEEGAVEGAEEGAVVTEVGAEEGAVVTEEGAEEGAVVTEEGAEEGAVEGAEEGAVVVTGVQGENSP